MTLFRAILMFHIAAGTAGLILEPVAMTARKGSRLHARAGEAYHWVMLAVCVSAAGLALLDWAPEFFAWGSEPATPCHRRAPPLA